MPAASKKCGGDVEKSYVFLYVVATPLGDSITITFRILLLSTQYLNFLPSSRLSRFCSVFHFVPSNKSLNTNLVFFGRFSTFVAAVFSQ